MGIAFPQRDDGRHLRETGVHGLLSENFERTGFMASSQATIVRTFGLGMGA
jgi:hypothetical protein